MRTILAFTRQEHARALWTLRAVRRKTLSTPAFDELEKLLAVARVWDSAILRCKDMEALRRLMEGMLAEGILEPIGAAD